MQCTDCELQGVSCPYTFMVVPGGQVPDPCPYKYKTRLELSKGFLDTAISGYMQVVYPEWNLEEVEKELRNFFDNMVKVVAENLRKDFNLDVVIKAEAQKLMGWVNEKHKGEGATITLTTTSQNGGMTNEKVRNSL